VSLVCACAAAWVAAAPARAETVLAVEHEWSYVGVYQGRVAWWSTDARGRSRLVTWAAGTLERTRVTLPKRALELDLGPDAHGHVAAVYSRCRRPDVACDVYEYNFAARRERRVRVAASPRRSETSPAIWRDRIAFAEDAKRIVLAGRRGSRRVVPGGTRGGEPGQIDLRGSTVAYAWYLRSDRCVDTTGGEKEGSEISEIWVWRAGEHRRVDQACTADFARVDEPTLSAGVVGYMRSAAASSVFRRRSLNGALLGDAALPSPFAAAADGATLAYVRRDPVSGDFVVALA